MSETNWLPGLLVLSASGAIGTFLALRSRRGAPLPTSSETHRADLLRQKDAAYTLIRDHDQARVDSDEWRDERTRLELEAARVLRAIDAAVADEPARVAFGARHPKLVGALWGGGIVAFGALLTFTLQEFAKPRDEGGTMTGNAQGDPAEQSAAIAASLAPLRAAVEADPADLDAKNRLGHALLNAGDAMAAHTLAEDVIKVDPANAEARTHQGVVLVEIGDMPLAGKVLDRVLATSPDFTEALGWRGAIYMQEGDGAKAAELWERAVAVDPGLGRELTPLIAQAKSGKTMAMAPKTASVPTESGLTQAAPSAQDVMGEITADGIPAGGTLFLYARAEGVDRGPPVWAQKLTPQAFPVRFRIGPADSPMGGATPEKLVLSARLDRDGDPSTKDDADPVGKSEPIAPGATGVVISLE